MYRDIAIYLDDVREIEEMFAAFDLNEAELDTDAIEDILSDWEQFIGVLRDEGDKALANQVMMKIEEIEERLRKCEETLIHAEEQSVVEEAGNRLSRSSMENLLAHQMTVKHQKPDIGREHQAEFRLRSREKDFPQRLKRLED